MFIKHIKYFVFLFVMILVFTSCVPAPGLQDYTIGLPGAYHLRRMSKDVILIQYGQKNYMGSGTDGAIRYFGFDDEYIFFETEVFIEKEESFFNYAAVNYLTNKYYQANSYDALEELLDRELLPYNEWLSTSISKIDWTDPLIAEQYLSKFRNTD